MHDYKRRWQSIQQTIVAGCEQPIEQRQAPRNNRGVLLRWFTVDLLPLFWQQPRRRSIWSHRYMISKFRWLPERS